MYKITSKLACLIIALFLFSSNFVTASEFDQDHMVMTPDCVLVHSVFSHEDHITAYNNYGTCLWDATFASEIVSWKLKNNYLYVFSKDRLYEKTSLVCMNPVTGYVLWTAP